LTRHLIIPPRWWRAVATSRSRCSRRCWLAGAFGTWIWWPRPGAPRPRGPKWPRGGVGGAILSPTTLASRGPWGRWGWARWGLRGCGTSLARRKGGPLGSRQGRGRRWRRRCDGAAKIDWKLRTLIISRGK